MTARPPRQLLAYIMEGHIQIPMAGQANGRSAKNRPWQKQMEHRPAGCQIEREEGPSLAQPELSDHGKN